MSALCYDYYSIIPHAHSRSVLALLTDGGWTLPHVQRRERAFWQDVGPINQAIYAQLGLQVTTLRCLQTAYDSALDRVQTVYVHENLNPDWSPPPGARWAAVDELSQLGLAPAGHRALVCDWFATQERQRESAPLVPWYSAGWFDRAARWIDDRLAQQRLRPVGRLRQLRAWQRSCLLAIDTDAGLCYFKAVPTCFAHEPALSQALATRYSDHFPSVLAVEPAEGWLLMRDVGGVSLARRADVAIWEEAVQTLARLQIDLARRTDQLRKLGCPPCDWQNMSARLDALWADGAALLSGRPAGLSAADMEALGGLGPHLRQLSQRLASFKIPVTLEHGDFWPGQVLVAHGRPHFIDWSDSSICHPFFSLAFFLDMTELEGYLADVPDLRLRLRHAYLSPWTIYEPMARLIEAFELSHPLAALHNALLYQERILPTLEQRWELHYMPAYFLKRLLHAMRELTPAAG